MNSSTPPTKSSNSKGLLLVGVLVIALGGGLVWWFNRDSEVDINSLSQGGVEEAIVPGSQKAVPQDSADADGWNTEVFNSQASKKLKTLGKAILKSSEIQKLPADFFYDSFQSTELEPSSGTVSTFKTGRVEVFHLTDPNTLNFKFAGKEGAQKCIQSLGELFKTSQNAHSKFKIIDVKVASGTNGQEVLNQAYFQASGENGNGTLQINATWGLTWSLNENGNIHQLKSLRLLAYEKIVTQLEHKAAFSDLTDALLGKSKVFEEQIRPGVDQWLGTIEANFGLDIGGWQGLAVGDVNNDQLEDLYVLQPGGLPNRLFVQNADGTFSETSKAAGVDWVEASHAGLFADLDNDGDQDLLTSTLDGVLIQANDGTGKFKTIQAKIHASAISYSFGAADYDEDGDLDIFVCGYNPRQGVDRHILFARPVPYHDANNGGRNMLLRNEGPTKNAPFVFREITKTVGLDENNKRFSYAVAWEDYDNDGDLDLYVANDFGRNNLYQNTNGIFKDVAPEAGVEDISPGMSACWGDFDNDGLVDLYVSNMFSSAGNRITNQAKFLKDADAKTRAEFRRHSRGNTLFKNLGDGKFKDISIEAGVTIGRWAWGSRFTDLNMDGLQDLLVTNGFITQEDTGDL